MEPADRSSSSLEKIRRLRGVTWSWRPGGPVERDGHEAGVIAQDVRAVLPELVHETADGHLRVDYGGLAVELGEAVLELNERMEEIEAYREEDDPVAAAIANLRASQLRPIDHNALVGTLVEAVKEIDRRLSELELISRSDGSETDV